jgi:hypothetical protein
MHDQNKLRSCCISETLPVMTTWVLRIESDVMISNLFSFLGQV